MTRDITVFVPFLGDFLSMIAVLTVVPIAIVFSSPFLGTFFQSEIIIWSDNSELVFVPFLGDFLSMVGVMVQSVSLPVFVPFLGDFLSMVQ